MNEIDVFIKDPPPRILEIKAKINKWDLIKAMVFPVVMYRCKSWTVKKAEQ